VNDEMRRLCTEIIIACLVALSKHLLQGSEVSHSKPQRWKPASPLRI